MLSIFKKKKNVITQDEILSQLINCEGDNLRLVIEFGRDKSLSRLTNIHPSLLIVLADIAKSNSDETEPKIGTLDKVSPILQSLSPVTPTLVTVSEFNQFAELYPLEMIHIKSGYSLYHGEDVLSGMTVDSSILYRAVKCELSSLILQLRSELVAESQSSQLGVHTLQRFYLIGKGLLELRHIPLSSGWVSLISEIESCYSVKEFALSEMIAALESGKVESLNAHLGSLLQVFEELYGKINAISGEDA